MYHFVYETTNLINQKVYIGKHSTSNLCDGYLGTGKYLKNSVKKYGKENFKRKILKFFETEQEAYGYEEKLVTNEFVSRKDTYNIITGGVGSEKGWTSVKDKQGTTFYVSTTDPRYISRELVGVSKNQVSVRNQKGNTLKVSTIDPRYLSGELVSIKKNTILVKDAEENYFSIPRDDHRYLSGELVGIAKNYVNVKDSEGFCIRISKTDPRYLSGELKHVASGLVSVKDKEGNTFSTCKDDPKYLDGSLVGVTKGRKLRYITNGTKSTAIHLTDQIPEGWGIGQLSKYEYIFFNARTKVIFKTRSLEFQCSLFHWSYRSLIHRMRKNYPEAYLNKEWLIKRQLFNA